RAAALCQDPWPVQQREHHGMRHGEYHRRWRLYHTQTGSIIKVGPNNTSAPTSICRTVFPSQLETRPVPLMHIDVYDNTIIGGSTTATGTLPGIVYSGFRKRR